MLFLKISFAIYSKLNYVNGVFKDNLKNSFHKTWTQKDIRQDSEKLLAMICYQVWHTAFCPESAIMILSFNLLIFTHQCLVLTWHADTLGFVVSFWSDTKK